MALVMSVGGAQPWRNGKLDEPTGAVGDSETWRDAMRSMVGGGHPTRADTGTSLGGPALPVAQRAMRGEAWPAEKRVKELADRRTANGRVFQLTDGRTQAEISIGPVNYRDARGRYQPI